MLPLSVGTYETDVAAFMIRKCAVFVFAICWLLPAPSVFSEDDVQYWSRLSIKAIDTNYFDYVTYGELRLTEDSSDFHFWQTSQKFQFDPIDHLSLAINYTHLQEEVSDSKTRKSEFKVHNRFELEVNPYAAIKDYVKIKSRNRIEFRWIEDRGSDNTRFRQMWQIEVPIKKVPFLQSIYINNELFYDFNREQFTQNRWIPGGVAIKIYEKSLIRIFYMIQSVKGRPDWSSNQILGTHIELAFL